jgi:hypothetical protein
VVAALSLAFSAAAADGLAHGRTPAGQMFVSGGIGQDELAALDAERGSYSLWIITAAKVTGAFLADVQVRITDAKNQVVFDEHLAGPWLLVNLPPGRFDVEASLEGETLKRSTTIHIADHHQIVFYFDVQADVLPKDAPG